MGASTFTIESTNLILGDSANIKIKSSSDTYINKLKFVAYTSFGSVQETIWEGNTIDLEYEINWNIDFNKYLTWFDNRFRRNFTLILETYEDGVLISPTQQKTIYVSLAEDIVPTLEIRASDNRSDITEKFIDFIQLKSELKISISANGVYGSTVTYCKVTFEDSVYTNLYSIQHGTINGNGSIPIVAKVVDSRGREAEQTLYINVLPYSPPKIKSFSAYRSNSDGSQSENSTKINAVIDFEISPVNNLNDNAYKIFYKAKESSEWLDLGISGNEYVLNSNFISNPVFALDVAYDIKLEIADFFHSSNVIVDIAQAYTLFDINGSGRGLAFGKVSDWADGIEFDIVTRFSKGVNYPILSDGTDLNSLVIPNKYILLRNNEYLNNPLSDTDCFLEIVGTENENLIQRIRPFSPDSETYDALERGYDSDGWRQWLTVAAKIYEQIWGRISSRIYPVGCVFFETENTSPKNRFGGTWEKVTTGISGVYAWKRTA